MLSDTEAACVAIALAVCLKKEKGSPQDQRVIQTKTTIIHTQVSGQP
jgi:hypothetical protein